MTESKLSTQAFAFVADFAAFARRRGVIALTFMVLGGVLEGVGLAFLAPVLAVLTGEAGGWAQGALGEFFTRFGAESQFSKLALLLAPFVLILIVRAFVLILRDRHLAALQLGFVEHHRIRLISALCAAQWQDVSGLRHARITHALGADSMRIASAAHMLMQSVVAAVMLASIWLLTLIVAPAISLVAFIMMVIAIVILRPILRQASALGRHLTGSNLDIINTATQLLGGLKLAMAQNMQSAFAAKFGATARELTKRQLEFQRQQAALRVATSTGAAFVGMLVLLTGLWLETPVASLLALMAMFSRMIGPAATLQQNAQNFANVLPAHVAFLKLLDDLKGLQELPSPSDAREMTGEVRFENVCYAHGSNANDGGVHALSVSIDPGEVVGLSGASGAGKTTFVDLLSGLLTPDSGVILIGGTPLNRSNASRWRARMAYVAQDSYLFNENIRHNLCWGHGEVDDATLWNALEIAGADQLVQRMDKGLDTLVAERGARLSGGERQRIALARALVRRPDLLILDEATNAIDLATERTILERLTALKPCPTIVIVAHRVETLQICRRVLTLRKGRLVDGESTL